MRKGWGLKAIAAAVTVSVALAACGGGGGGDAVKVPSALDPANMVPDTTLAYAAVTVRPRGTLRADLTQAIDSVAGAGTTKHLITELDKQLATRDSGVFSQIQSWVGQRVGFAFVSYPQTPDGLQSLLDEVLIVAPTDDPSAAKSFLANHFNSAGLSGSVVGNYAIFGGQAAVGAALATTQATSLARTAPYRTEMKELGPGRLLTLFMREGALIRQLLPEFRAQASVNPMLHMELPSVIQQARRAGDAALAISAAPDALRLDVVEQRPAPRGANSPSALAALPGDSWLALHLGGRLANKSYLHMLAQFVPTLIAQEEARTGTTLPSNNPAINFVEKDLLPALGPISVGVAGTTRSTARFGVELTPADPSAGERLLAGIRSLLKGQAKGQPVRTGDSGGNVLLTYGYKTIQDFMTPSSKLGANPAFRSAASRLPPGSKPGLYLNFAAVNALMLLDHNPKDATAKRILGKFDYVIAGGTPTHFRLVVAVK